MTIHIRPLNPSSPAEIGLVARRMRETLEEVLGEERGREMYTIEWLQERVRFHLDSGQSTAAIFISENENHEITGQAIVRRERKEDGTEYGYFSTIFVDPKSRAKGIAKALIREVESWIASQGLGEVVYNTAEANTPLIRLLESHGFAVTATHPDIEMVTLTKCYF